MSEEVKQTVYVAITAILLASLFGFISYLMSLRTDFAEVRNNEIATAQVLRDHREFSKFNNAVVYGEDIVAAIRDYYDTGIRIRVNDSSLNLRPTYETVSGVYNIDKTIARSTNNEKVDLTRLQSWFPTTKKYKAVLVYGQVDLSTVTLAWANSSSNTGVNNNVSAIVFFYEGLR